MDKIGQNRQHGRFGINGQNCTIWKKSDKWQKNQIYRTTRRCSRFKCLKMFRKYFLDAMRFDPGNFKKIVSLTPDDFSSFSSCLSWPSSSSAMLWVALILGAIPTCLRWSNFLWMSELLLLLFIAPRQKQACNC